MTKSPKNTKTCSKAVAKLSKVWHEKRSIQSACIYWYTCAYYCIHKYVYIICICVYTIHVYSTYVYNMHVYSTHVYNMHVYISHMSILCVYTHIYIHHNTEIYIYLMLNSQIYLSSTYLFQWFWVKTGGCNLPERMIIRKALASLPSRNLRWRQHWGNAVTCHVKIWGLEQYGVSENGGLSPQIIHFNRDFHYKPSILGYPYFWKHPYEKCSFWSCKVSSCYIIH